MYLSVTEDYGSHGSLNCSLGQPVTPDSVLGANILLDGDGNSSKCSSGAPPMPRSPQSSTSSSSQQDLASSSPHLLNILKTESAEQYQVTPNYLHSSVLIPSPQDSKDQGVSERCRRRTCEWMYDICDYFQLNREVVGIALFYVDRYFTITFEGGPSGSGQNPVTRRQFQLVALTGLYIAVKLHGESRQENLVMVSQERDLMGSPSQPTASQQHPQPWNRLKFSLAICASISRNQFSPREIEACERKMLSTLDWHVNPVVSSGTIIDTLLVHLPSAFSGAKSMIDHHGATTTDEHSLALFVYDCAKYLAELSVSVPALSLVYKPSVVAYASVLYALDNISAKSGGSDSPLTEQGRQEFENLILQVSSRHFDREKDNVEGAKKILRAICPNLSELFPPPSLTPKSPTSVNLS